MTTRTGPSRNSRLSCHITSTEWINEIVKPDHSTTTSSYQTARDCPSEQGTETNLVTAREARITQKVQLARLNTLARWSFRKLALGRERACATATVKSTIFEGPIAPILIRLSGPIYVGMCIQVAFYITNTLWLAFIDRNSGAYIGAMGMILPIAQILLAICNGMTVAVSSITARAVGESDKSKMGAVASSGFLMAGVIATAIVVIGYTFDEEIVRALGARGEYFEHAHGYLQYILPGAVLLCVASVFSGILQGFGLMKAVMLALLVGTVGNIILDPVFIRVLDMRLKGSALATVVSQLGIVVYYFYVVFKKRLINRTCLAASSMNLNVVRSLVAIAAPVSFSQLAVAFSFLVYNRIIVDIDILAVASFSLCARFDQIVLMPVSAISVSLNTLVGQNVGRRNYERVRKIWRVALLGSCVIVSILATAMILFVPFLYGSVQKNAVILSYAIRQTRVMEYGFLFSATCMLANSVFQAIGRPRRTVLITLVQLFLVAIPVMLMFKSLASMNMNVVWGSLMAGNFVAAGISVVWMRNTLRFRLPRMEI